MKKILLNSIILFGLGFIIHMGGDWFGSTPVLRYLFPQNESIVEHSKLYTTAILIEIIICLIRNKNTKNINILVLLISLVIMIILNNTVFTIVEYITVIHNMVLTLILYFFILNISQYIGCNIAKQYTSDDKLYRTIIFLIVIITIYVIAITS